MGNSDSHLGTGKHQKVERRLNSAPRDQASRKRHSLTPTSLQTPARCSSLKLENGGATLKPNDSSGTVSEQQQLEVNRRIQQRRAKSFRGGRPSGSFRVPVCPVTGLTSTQKRLIEARWHELDKQAVLELGRNVFETLFRREPRFLQALGLRHLAGPRINEWRFHVNFRVQVQRFCEAVDEVVKSFEQPRYTMDRLQELGALHLTAFGPSAARRLPPGYWDGLVAAFSKAAKDLQVETSSRGSESPSTAAFDRRFLLPGDEPSLSTPPSPGPLAGLAPHPRRSGSVCPRAAEAWHLLGLYMVGQIRFGYEMERLLQAELRRLGPGAAPAGPGSVGSESGSNSSESPRSDGRIAV